MTFRRREAALAVGALVAVLAFGLLLGLLRDPGRERTPVKEAITLETGEVLLYVNTCLGDPALDVVSEDASGVVIAVESAVQSGDQPRPACLDSVPLKLSRPLDDRERLDDTTGRVISVPPPPVARCR